MEAVYKTGVKGPPARMGVPHYDTGKTNNLVHPIEN